MIFATGDMHGDISRFKEKAIKRLKKNDTLFVCGDFGFIFDGSEKEQKLLKWIGKRRFNTVFVEGCNDNMDLIEQYPESDWMGGRVRVISGNLMYAARGSLFSIEGRNILTMGGGESSSADMGRDWWEKNLPTLEETALADQKLAEYRYVVDYIISHDCPTIIKSCVGGSEGTYNYLHTFFDNLQKNGRYKGWFFGRYHMDRLIPPYYQALYREVASLQ